ncbi:hypothetical protein WISP_80581 [Willisornis vidua]|uniref:Peptidase S74 domain-containing protein n=1 Tax=Willisornis vidua TaxID=1566151 RepID=A0ABQ9D9U8_9PASS|nr:hypothetical protein WISP_80581 [Willisornis vidua]
MRSKQDECEAFAQSQGFHVTGIRETWWDETCDWSALLDDYRLFRRNRQGRRVVGVALYVIGGLECMEVTTGNGTVERLWGKRDTSKSTATVPMGNFSLTEINDHHTADKTWTRRLLKHLDDNVIEKGLRELTWNDARLDLLLTVFEQSWESGEVPAVWKLVDIVPVFKKSKKDDPRNCSTELLSRKSYLFSMTWAIAQEIAELRSRLENFEQLQVER